MWELILLVYYRKHKSAHKNICDNKKYINQSLNAPVKRIYYNLFIYLNIFLLCFNDSSFWAGCKEVWLIFICTTFKWLEKETTSLSLNTYLNVVIFSQRRCVHDVRQTLITWFAAGKKNVALFSYQKKKQLKCKRIQWPLVACLLFRSMYY